MFATIVRVYRDPDKLDEQDREIRGFGNNCSLQISRFTLRRLAVPCHMFSFPRKRRNYADYGRRAQISRIRNGNEDDFCSAPGVDAERFVDDNDWLRGAVIRRERSSRCSRTCNKMLSRWTMLGMAADIRGARRYRSSNRRRRRYLEVTIAQLFPLTRLTLTTNRIEKSHCAAGCNSDGKSRARRPSSRWNHGKMVREQRRDKWTDRLCRQTDKYQLGSRRKMCSAPAAGVLVVCLSPCSTWTRIIHDQMPSRRNQVSPRHDNNIGCKVVVMSFDLLASSASTFLLLRVVRTKRPIKCYYHYLLTSVENNFLRV